MVAMLHVTTEPSANAYGAITIRPDWRMLDVKPLATRDDYEAVRFIEHPRP